MNSFTLSIRNLSLRQRMAFIVACVAIMGIGLVYFSNRTIAQSEQVAQDVGGELAEQAQRDRIETSTDILAASLGRELATLPDLAAKRAAVTAAVENVRFDLDKSGYFFVYEGTTVVSVPIKPELAGKDLAGTVDPNGVPFVRELVEKAERGGGFVDYVFAKPGSGDIPKVGYATMIPGTPFMIGTGVYLDNVAVVQASIQARVATAVAGPQRSFWIFAMVLGFLTIGVVIMIGHKIVSALTSMSDGLKVGSEGVERAASSISETGDSLASGTSEQAASIQETSAAVEELTAAISGNAEHSVQAHDTMNAAIHDIEDASSAVSKLDDAMKSIRESSQQTRKIVKTIDEIAFQTNILALNAAVEAARAGEAGAGFAVVADEVRSLAMRAAEAARNTTALITGAETTIERGSRQLESTTSAFDGVSEHSRKASGLIEKVSTASKEQARGVEQISLAMHQMDKVTQGTAASAEESSAASQEMRAQAIELNRISQGLYGLIHGGTVAASTAAPAPPAPQIQPMGQPACSPPRSVGQVGAVNGTHAVPTNHVKAMADDASDFFRD